MHLQAREQNSFLIVLQTFVYDLNPWQFFYKQRRVSSCNVLTKLPRTREIDYSVSQCIYNIAN